MERKPGFGGSTGSYGWLLTAVAAVDAVRFRSMYPRPLPPRKREATSG